MARRTTLSVEKDARERLGRFERSVGTNSATESINELLDIAAEAGYWDGSAEPMTVSQERIEELEKDQQSLAESFIELRKQVEEYHGGSGE